MKLEIEQWVMNMMSAKVVFVIGKNETVLLERSGSHQGFHSQKVMLPQKEKKTLSIRLQQMTVSTKMCFLEAKKIASELGVINFKASRCFSTRCG